MPEFTVATYNAAFYKKAERSDFKRLFGEADIVLFQEMGRKIDHRHLKSFSDTFDHFVGASKGTPIAWRKSDFKLLGKGSKKISKPTRIARGAGPKRQPAKYLVWVKLRHKASGRVFYVGNCHLTPSLYVPARYRVHDGQTDKIRGWARRKPNNVIFGGDFNIDAKKDEAERDANMPFVKFGRIKVHSGYRALGFTEKGTHKRRHIDYIFFRKHPKRFSPVEHWIVSGLSSDHRAYVIKFDVTLTRRKRLLARLRRQ